LRKYFGFGLLGFGLPSCELSRLFEVQSEKKIFFLMFNGALVKLELNAFDITTLDMLSLVKLDYGGFILVSKLNICLKKCYSLQTWSIVAQK